MADLHNTKRALGRFFNHPAGFLSGAAMAATAGLIAPNTPLMKDAEPAISVTANEAAIENIQQDIAAATSIREDYNEASNEYYSNLYGDRETRDQAKERVDQLDQRLDQNRYRIISNLYLNPNFNRDNFEDLSEQIQDAGIPVTIPLTGGSEHRLMQNDSEFYKNCQIETQMNFSDNPLNQALNMDRCMRDQDIDDNGRHIGTLMAGGLGGLFLMWLLQAGTYNWSYYNRREKPPKVKKPARN